MSGLLGHGHPSQLRVPRNRVRFKRAQYDAERIRAEIEALRDTAGESAKKLDALLQELRGLRADGRSLFWVILIAVIAAELLYPLVRAVIVGVLNAIGARH